MANPSDAGFGVYVHWPFCAAKCPYCDFNSHVRHQPVDQSRYLKAFKREIASIAERTPNRSVSSVFLGGGTPSLMDPRTVESIIDAIASAWTVEPGAEITLEANPSSVEAERFRGYRTAGVNRVSLGVQALNDKDLQALGRLHTAEEALAAVEIARNTFPRISFDLIYARPEQSPDSWAIELAQALDRAADHVSLYQLTIEEGTPFFALHRAGKLKTPGDDDAVAFYAITQETCDRFGLPAYEISNHAKRGSECRHNLLYWRYGEYAGIGPGAHGRLILPDGRHATAAIKNPETWLSRVESWGDGLETDEILSRDEEADEILLMGLRLNEGIDLERYQTLAHRSLDPGRLADLTRHGMVETLPDDRVRATRAGAFVLDAVVADLAA
jgi:putative oxygen-independent coproporphyrinogen III oxidase